MQRRVQVGRAVEGGRGKPRESSPPAGPRPNILRFAGVSKKGISGARSQVASLIGITVLLQTTWVRNIEHFPVSTGGFSKRAHQEKDGRREDEIRVTEGEREQSNRRHGRY